MCELGVDRGGNHVGKPRWARSADDDPVAPGARGGEPGDRLDGCRVRRVGHPERGQGDRTGGEETGTAVAAFPQRDVHGPVDAAAAVSRVPSTGSTIHTREASRRDKSSADSAEHGIVGSQAGEQFLQEVVGLPVAGVAELRPTAPTRRTEFNRSPAAVASAAASSTSDRSAVNASGWPSHNPRSRSIASATSPAGPSSG